MYLTILYLNFGNVLGYDFRLGNAPQRIIANLLYAVFHYWLYGAIAVIQP